ncbi:hypothetical protein Lesp02_07110 [Lentzea sp. NBRC 105346]|nr:hypothetical protein Lesp02_07110 [Lentzea sp. NBRC 105346]
MLGRALLEEIDPQRRFDAEVEPVPDRFTQRDVDVVRSRGDPRDVDLVEHDLVRPGRGLREDRAQRLVPGHDVRDGLAQRGAVQRAGDPQRGGDVVGGRRALEAVQEPQALLRERQRHGLGPRSPFERLAGFTAGARGEGGDRGTVEQVAHAELDAQAGADPVDQPGGEQRVAAEVEEVVVDADFLEPEHLGEKSTKDLFDGVARRPALSGRVLGCGQQVAVELAVARQRQRVQHHERRRHHVVGQRPGRVLAHAFGTAHQVGDQPLVPRPVLAQQHGGLADVRVFEQHGLDLAELDAVAVQLDLVVRAAEELEVAVGAPPGQVTGPVHPAGAVGVGDEPFGGESRPVEVAAGELRSGDVDLTADADRCGPQRRIEHVHPGVPVRLPEREHARRHDLAGFDRVLGAADRGLGGAVLVDHADAGVAVPPLVEQVAVQRFAARHELGARAEVAGQQVEQREVAGRDLEVVRLLGGVAFERSDVDAAAADEWRVQGGDGQVERG